MIVSDRAMWETWLAKNKDPYGEAVVLYAERWADVMETQMEAGAALEDIAEGASHEADTDGITGFMYSMAVNVLVSCWIHGERLRRWHNLKHQIRDEGEKANETGGILNTAVLEIGEK